jgi:enoyl-CoA hydratase/carnithine racemase
MFEELWPLPGQVVVVEHGGTSGESFGHHVPGRLVEGQGQQILDHHQVGTSQSVVDLDPRGRLDSADGQAGHRLVDKAVTGHRVGSEVELLQGLLPFGGLDGHAVGAAEAEREEGDRGDAVTVPAPPPEATGRARSGYRRSVHDDTFTSKEISDDLLAVREGPVLTLTINRPERRNAMTWDVIAGLRRELAAAKVDPSVRVVVLAGAGDQAFCAGADLSGMVPNEPGGTSDEYVNYHLARGRLAQLFEEMWALGKPTIARVQGWAMAGGFGLALACDMVIAADSARFGAPELNVGLWPYMVTVSLLRSMPPKKALELMLTSRVVGAEEADRIGFVTRVVPDSELDAAVADLAAVLVSKPPGVTKLGRDSFYAVIDSAASEALPYLHAMLTVTSQTAEAREGITAFAEKRPPSWQLPADDSTA